MGAGARRRLLDGATDCFDVRGLGELEDSSRDEEVGKVQAAGETLERRFRGCTSVECELLGRFKQSKRQKERCEEGEADQEVVVPLTADQFCLSPQTRLAFRSA